MGAGKEEELAPERFDRLGKARSQDVAEEQVERGVGGGGVGGVVGVGVGVA